MRDLLAKLFTKDHGKETLKTKTYLLLAKDRQAIGLTSTSKIKTYDDTTL